MYSRLLCNDRPIAAQCRPPINPTLHSANVQGDVGVSGLVISLAATAIVADCRQRQRRVRYCDQKDGNDNT